MCGSGLGCGGVVSGPEVEGDEVRGPRLVTGRRGHCLWCWHMVYKDAHLLAMPAEGESLSVAY